MPQPPPEEIQRQIVELQGLRARTRRWRLGGILGVLAVVLICVYLIIDSVMVLAKPGAPQEKLKAHLKEGIDKQVVEPLEQLAKSTQKQVWKDVEKELDKLRLRTPEFGEALNKELMALQNSLPNRAEKVLEGTLGKELNARKSVLKKRYPGVTDEKITTVVDNIVSESHASMEHLSHVMFGQHNKSLNNIFTHIDTIQKSEPVVPDTEQTSWETVLLVFDIIRDELRVFEQPPMDAPAPKPTKQARAKSVKKKENAQ